MLTFVANYKIKALEHKMAISRGKIFFGVDVPQHRYLMEKYSNELRVILLKSVKR